MVDGQFGGLLVYGLGDNRIVLTHTFIAEGFRGRGLSNFMIESMLDDVRAHGHTVTNFCPVLDHFFDTHPQYVPLIDERVPGTWSRREHESRLAKQESAPQVVPLRTRTSSSIAGDTPLARRDSSARPCSTR